MELSGLKLEKTARRATYNGGILSPASIQSPPTPSTSTDGLKSADGKHITSIVLYHAAHHHYIFRF